MEAEIEALEPRTSGALFFLLRGKRKRAMYILKHHRQEIPESPYVERPDQGLDPIDRNVVLVARQAADILEFEYGQP
jgi:hypothetical protein